MSRVLKWLPALALSVALVLPACSPESPVAPPEADPVAAQAQARSPEAVPDQYIVVFKPGVADPPGLVRQFSTAHGLQVDHEYRYAVQGFAATIPAQAVDALRRNPNVEFIAPNLVYQLDAPWSAPAAVASTAPPAAPSDLVPTVGSSRIDLTWQDNATDEKGMEVWRSTDGATGSFGRYTRLRRDTETYSDGAVIDGVEHCYYIVAVAGKESSAPSNIACATPGAPPPPPEPPAPPTGLGATASGTTGIDLSWTDASADEDGFRVERRTGQTGTWGEVATTTADATSYADGGLLEATEYCYRVTAFNGVGASDPSNVACATTEASPPPPPEPPAPPTGLGATASGTTGIDLSWTDASADEDGFRIERQTGQTGTWGEIATTGPDVTTYGDGGLLEATEYCYRVSAFNGVGTSDPSEVACATTEAAPGDLPVPVAVPTSGLRVRLVANDLLGGEIGSWPNRGTEGDAVQGDAARRPVYHEPSTEFNGNASVGFNEGGDNDEMLEIGGVATHASGTLVVVYEPEDDGASSSTVFAPYGTSSSRTNMPTSRFGLTEPMDYSTTTMRAWLGGTLTPTAGQPHVAVWRTDASALTDLQLNGEPAGSSTTAGGYPTFDRYLVGMAQPSSSERFDGRVAELLFYDRALLGCEVDKIVADLGARYGVVVTATGEGCNPPGDPTGLAASVVGYDAIDLSWTDGSANEDGFRVERRTGQAGAWGEIVTTGPDATAYEDRSLLQQTEYCYRVSAFNEVGPSDPSNVVCATTNSLDLPGPVTVPTNGLRVRLVANDLLGGEIGSWPNRGSEGDAVQGDAARRPVYHEPSTAFNGNASVGFNEGGDNDEMLEIGGVATHASGTLVVVYEPEDDGASSSTVFAPYGTSSSRTNMPTSRFGLTEPMDYSTTTMRAWLGGTLTPAAGQSHVAVWRTDASALTDLQLDGEPAGSSTTAGGYPTFDRYLVGMAQPSSSERFDGRVAELLFYDRALLGCEVDKIVADLGARYGAVVTATGEGCNPPGDPTGLAASVVGYDAIDLSWTDGSANEDGFRVERRTGQAGAWGEIVTTGPDATAYEDRSLLQQTEYCYRVSAFNDGGISAYSEVACATTEEAPPGACVDTGNHDDLTDLYGIVAVGAPANQVWSSTQLPGCEITPWYFGIDSGVDSDHPDLNVIESTNFVAAEPDHDGEDRNGHGTHTAGSAAARDGNGGVVGVAPGARIHSFRVCEDGGSCQTADMVAAMDEVIARKLANPDQPIVANMSIGGPADAVIDQALRNSINAGIVYAVAAGNGILGACIFPADASGVSPARVGDDAIDQDGGSSGNDGLVNGVITTTSHDSSNSDVNCNYGAPVSVAAPGYQIRSTWLNGGYNTISGTSMASPHAAGAAMLYLQSHPGASPADVEAAILSRLQPWSTNEQPNAAGRLFVDGL